uniref:Uncharacterized protein n=1 Tax=viral metagenome TaxID=1070528 RepID=A0A6M3LR46_9ZZZZ
MTPKCANCNSSLQWNKKEVMLFDDGCAHRFTEKCKCGYITIYCLWPNETFVQSWYEKPE